MHVIGASGREPVVGQQLVHTLEGAFWERNRSSHTTEVRPPHAITCLVCEVVSAAIPGSCGQPSVSLVHTGSRRSAKSSSSAITHTMARLPHLRPAQSSRSLGGALAIGAGAIGAVGFRGSQRRQRQGIADWVSCRDSVLGLAITAFTMAFLLSGIGTFWQASTGAQNGFDSTRIALVWLAGAALIGNAIASVCAADGFSRSRR